MLRILLICASICVLVQSRSERRRCQFFASGIVCADNLRGFFKCDGSNPFGEFEACGTNEICSCGKNRPCPEGRPVCIPGPQFTLAQVPKDFTVTYHGQMNVSFPAGRILNIITGSVRQSFVPGKEQLMDSTTFRDMKTGKFLKRIIKITKRISSRKTEEVSAFTLNCVWIS